MKKQKMYNATEVAKLLNNQMIQVLKKELNVEHVAKKKVVQLKTAPKRVATAAKKSKKKIKPVSQKKLFERKQIKVQTNKDKKEKVKKKLCSKSILEGGTRPLSDSGNWLRMRRHNPLETPVVSKKEELPKKRPVNFFSKLLNGFKKKRV